MDHCTVETGLLRKKPCGNAAVTRCSNCEQPLCAQHAVAQLTEAGVKSGKFLCKECEVALREQKKTLDALARSAPPAPRKPSAPAAAKQAPAEGKGGGIDFTPGKDKK